MEVWRKDLYLAHHGILGQKWGKKNGPPYPIDPEDHSTSERKAGWRRSLNRVFAGNRNSTNKRYDVDVDSAKQKYKQSKQKYSNARTEYYKSIGKANVGKAADKMLKSLYNMQYAKEDLANERIKNEINNKGLNKSKSFLKAEEKFKARGMNDEEAELAAYKYQKTKKILAVAAGLTVAAAAAYITYKNYDELFDRVLTSDVTLQSVTRNSNKGVERAFYAAYLGSDKLKYRGYYGGYELGGLKGTPVYNATIRAKDRIKIASDRHALKALRQLVSEDSDFMSQLKTQLKTYSTDDNIALKGYESLSKGKVNKYVLESLNSMLPFHDSLSQTINDRFYSKLKSAGYDAIRDVNDRKYSGYYTKNPIIVFGGKGKAFVESVKQLDPKYMAIEYGVATGAMRDEAIKRSTRFVRYLSAAPTAITTGAVATGVAKSNRSRRKRHDEIVAEYKKEHPNTKLSYTEIVRLIEMGGG